MSSKSKPKSTAPSLGYLAGPLRSPQRTPAINPPLPAPNVASLVTQSDSSENSTCRLFATSSHYRNLSRSLLTWFESLNVPRCEFLPTWMPQNGLNVVDRFGALTCSKSIPQKNRGQPRLFGNSRLTDAILKATISLLSEMAASHSRVSFPDVYLHSVHNKMS